jgi:hypothetical protein
MTDTTDHLAEALIWERARLAASKQNPLPAAPASCRAKVHQPIRDFPDIVWRCCRGAHAGTPHQSWGFDGRVVREWS